MTDPEPAGVRQRRSTGRTARMMWRRLGLLAPERGAPAPRPLTFWTATVIFVLAIVLAYLFVGAWFTIVTAVLAVVTIRFNPDPGRPFAFATVALIVGAAFVSTAMVRPGPSDPTILFAQARHLAAQLGSFAGVFFAIATMMYAVTERPRTTAAPRSVPPVVAVRRSWAVLRSDAALAVGELGAIALAVAIGAAVRLALAPSALPRELTPLIENLRLGTVYSFDAGGAATPTALWPPLGVGLTAYLPVGGKVVALAVSVAVVVAGAWCAWRWSGRTAAVWAAWGLALLPACWSLSLDELLAALFVLLAVGVVAGAEPRMGDALVAGVFAGLAVVGRPDAIVVVPLLALLLAERRRAGHGGLTPAVALGLVAALLAGVAVMAGAWINYTTAAFGFPYLAETVRAALRDPIGLAGGGVGRLAGSAVLLGLVAWSVAAAAPSERRRSLPILAMGAWCLLTAGLTAQLQDPLSWSAPVLVVVVAGVRPWEGRGPDRRSGLRGRTTTPASDPASTVEAPR